MDDDRRPPPSSRRAGRLRVIVVRFLAGGVVGIAGALVLFALLLVLAPSEALVRKAASATERARSLMSAAPTGIEPNRSVAIRVVVDVDGVPFAVDGAVAGTVPTTLEVDAGWHEVVIGPPDDASSFQRLVTADSDAWCFVKRDDYGFRAVTCPEPDPGQ